MSEQTLRRKWRWLRHVAWVLAANVTLALIAVCVFFGSGAGNPLLQRIAIRRINAMTGGQTEIRSLSIQWLALRASVKGLVIHGKEPLGTEPLFASEEVRAGLHIDSFWGREVSLSELVVREPHVHIRVEKDGSTNVPGASRRSTKPQRETLFALRIQHLELQNGWVLYNDVKTPLALDGGDLQPHTRCRRQPGPSALRRKSCVAKYHLHGQALSSAADQRFSKIHCLATRVHHRARPVCYRYFTNRSASGDVRFQGAAMEISLPRLGESRGFPQDIARADDADGESGSARRRHFRRRRIKRDRDIFWF